MEYQIIGTFVISTVRPFFAYLQRVLVYYRKRDGWEKSGAQLPTEQTLSIGYNADTPRGAYTWPEALAIVEAEIASGSLEHYRIEICPASTGEIKRARRQGGPK